MVNNSFRVAVSEMNTKSISHVSEFRGVFTAGEEDQLLEVQGDEHAGLRLSAQGRRGARSHRAISILMGARGARTHPSIVFINEAYDFDNGRPTHGAWFLVSAFDTWARIGCQ